MRSARACRLRGTTLAVAAVLAIGAPAHAAPWSAIRSTHVSVVGDAPDARLRDVALQLERFREVVEQAFPNIRALDLAPTVVVVFETDRAMRPFKPVREGKVQDGVGGVVLPGDDQHHLVFSLEAGAPGFETVLSEYATLLVRSTIPGAPLWVSNGLGRYYGTFATASDGKGASIGLAPTRLLARARERILPVETVLAAGYNSTLSRDDGQKDAFDASCWALVHYLISSTPEGMPGVSTYLGMTMRGAPATQAFKDAFHVEPAELTAKLRQYVSRPGLESTVVPFGDRPATSRTVPAVALSDAQMHAHLADIFVSASRDVQAEQAFGLAFAAPSPPARAYIARGRLRLRQRRPIEAWPDLARAAELDVDDAATQFLLGFSALSWASGRSATIDRVRLEAALRALERATTLQPEWAEAWHARARTLVLLGDDLPAARLAIEHAAELGPGREEYRLLLAQVALGQRDTSAAREALGTLAARASRLEIVQRARTILAEIAKAENADPSARGDRGAPVPRAADEAADSSGAPPSSEHRGTYELMLRALASGEQRVLGAVTTIDCGPLGVLFYVRTASASLRLFTPAFDAVEFITYRDAVGGSIACGPQSTLDHVFVSFRPRGSARTKMGGAYDGEVLAVEMLPRDYTP